MAICWSLVLLDGLQKKEILLVVYYKSQSLQYHTGHVLVRAAGMGSRTGLDAQRLVTAMRFDKFDVRG